MGTCALQLVYDYSTLTSSGSLFTPAPPQEEPDCMQTMLWFLPISELSDTLAGLLP